MLEINVLIPDFDQIVAYGKAAAAKAATGAMQEIVEGATAEYRGAIVGAGLGQRLSQAVGGHAYPDRPRIFSLEPGGYIAPAKGSASRIVDSFAKGATIRPVNGAKYLWIPTRNVPQKRGRGGKGPMNPFEVEDHFNTDLEIVKAGPGHKGLFLAFINVIAGLRRGYRPATEGRKNQGRVAEDVLMFTLVPMVRLPKKLDLDKIARKWAGRFAGAFDRRFER